MVRAGVEQLGKPQKNSQNFPQATQKNAQTVIPYCLNLNRKKTSQATDSQLCTPVTHHEKKIKQNDMYL